MPTGVFMTLFQKWQCHLRHHPLSVPLLLGRLEQRLSALVSTRPMISSAVFLMREISPRDRGREARWMRRKKGGVDTSCSSKTHSNKHWQ